MALNKTPFYYFPMGTLPGLLLTSLLSLFYGGLAILQVLFILLKSGRAFFAVKDRTGKNRPKVLDNYGAHEFIYLKKQGIKLHYVSSGSEDKQMMLFVHGFPECWFSWRHQMKEFSGSYRTVALNLRGYGESDKPQGVANYTQELLIADVIEFMESMVTKQNPKAIVVAHDWGGILAWSAVQLRPDLVDRFIVLNAPHPVSWATRIATDYRQFFSSWYMFAFNFPCVAEIMFRNNDFNVFDKLFGKYQSSGENEVYKCYFSQSYGTTAPLNFYRASLRGYGSGRKRRDAGLGAKKLEPKTIIIWGKDDVALISELATDSAQLCRDAEVQYVSNCSHWIQIEKPDEVNRIMKTFLSK